eukprot:332845-Amphidinium_carterae.1
MPLRMVLTSGYNYAWLCSAKYLFVDLTNAVFQTSTALVDMAKSASASPPQKLCTIVSCKTPGEGQIV